MEPLLSAKEVASILGVSLNTVYIHAKAGQIPCIKIGSNYRFQPAALDAWVKKGIHFGDANLSER